MKQLRIWRTQGDADGNQVIETWTAADDHLTGVTLHDSGALMIYAGVDRPPVKVLSFGAWSEYTCD